MSLRAYLSPYDRPGGGGGCKVCDCSAAQMFSLMLCMPLYRIGRYLLISFFGILPQAMFELVTSEASYYKSLNLLVSHFMENERLKKILHQSEAHILFSNVLDVMAVSER